MPDSEMLISLGEALDVSVGALLGETAAAPEPNNLETLAGKLEVVNLQIARMQAAKRRMARRLLIALAAALAIVFVALAAVDGSYLDWNPPTPKAPSPRRYSMGSNGSTCASPRSLSSAPSQA